jgi:hypothetical protein
MFETCQDDLRKGRYILFVMVEKRYWVIGWLWLILSPVFAGNTGNEATHDAQAKVWPAAWVVPDKFQDVFDLLIDDIPYLHPQKIIIRKKKLSTTMSARPTWGSLIFRKRENRTYLLQVNNDKTFDGVLYEDVPEMARVGLMMHELMHIKDYQSRNFFGVLQRGWQYLSKSGKKKFEYEIDQMVMDAGYRSYLLLWALFIMEESEASDAYKDFKREIYRSPFDIFIDLDEDGFLKDSFLIL